MLLYNINMFIYYTINYDEIIYIYQTWTTPPSQVTVFFVQILKSHRNNK